MGNTATRGRGYWVSQFRTEILIAASRTCGDPEVLSRLAAIPDRTYAGSFYVMQAMKLFARDAAA